MTEARELETATTTDQILVPHFIKGKVKLSGDIEHKARGTGVDVVTPRISLDELVWSRNEPGPAFDLPMSEIIEFLNEAGQLMDVDRNPYFAEALDQLDRCSKLGRRVLENCYRQIPHTFRREGIELEIERALGGAEYLDGWKNSPALGTRGRIRAFPPRLVHVLAGNAPAVPPLTIVRGAITKGVHLLKLPSNDFFTATAILRTFADMAPSHPITRSFSAVYWRGGDERIESSIYRSQYYDKIIVWGGEGAVRHAAKYVAPGFEMVSFDPKVSISMIGREIFESEATIAEAAELAGADVMAYDQDACSSSRFQFVEGTTEQVDQYCRELLRVISKESQFGNEVVPRLAPEIREEIDALRNLDPIYAVFGKYDGRGIVIRSEEPVGFTPSGKTVNVVQVEDLAYAIQHVTVATQTVGIWPNARRQLLRDSLACAGAQRIATLGTSSIMGGFGGVPHDGSWPVNRFMRWISDGGPEQ